jgi:preprotein translocase subunit YajC
MFWEQAAWAMAPQPGQGGEAPPQLGLFWVLMPLLVIFWIFLVVPQRKQQKQHQQKIEALKKGDRVVTNGGIYGTVVKTEEHSVVLAVGEMGGLPPLKKKPAERLRSIYASPNRLSPRFWAIPLRKASRNPDFPDSRSEWDLRTRSLSVAGWPDTGSCDRQAVEKGLLSFLTALGVGGYDPAFHDL